ncbi:phosphogluconate dehydrogenase (NAD(+)-dependent, decarboxylating) [Altericroceibacterium xinjiangense]|uniref:phosphogluconate dehydrogenase (NAD(+)-dependent, decarboxylating) n=1 Tax=Altericroceibacterium xinjiangense TaxID=762261 RepID=UPI000F7F93CB|nr:decarboxylating 6-phosphogluconate dehydrogenase [Altericroceibacterium xinjiangense]
MQLGMIGLGRMGLNMAQRLLHRGHEIVGYDTKQSAVTDLTDAGGKGASSLSDLRSQLESPAAVWVMLPAGEVTESVIAELRDILSPGDVLIDGGNTCYKDDVRRARELAPTGIQYVDVGTSGGIFGLERGFCLMVGGPDDAVHRLDPIFAALAPGYEMGPRTAGRTGEYSSSENGYIHAGPAGAGHFVKMVHNGIEYGLMQAYAEGFDLLKTRASEHLPEDERYEFDLSEIAEVWRRGSVVSSWLLDLCAEALTANESLEGFSGQVPDSGEGRWTLEAAIEQSVPVNVLSAALFARFRSRSSNTYGERLLSAMRFGFGGHSEMPKMHLEE